MPNSPTGWVRPGLAPREHTATRLLGLSFDAPASPRVTLRGIGPSLRGQSYGWGFSWFPDQSAAAMVVKDATSTGENPMTKLLREWDRFQSTLFVCHLRGATRALREQDTQPFTKSYGGRDWILAHNGDLEVPPGQTLSDLLPLGDGPLLEPVGRSDSEHALCWLLHEARAVGARSLADIGWPRLHAWFRKLDALGTANFVLTDGRDLAVYRDETGYNALHFARLCPPHAPEHLETADLLLDFDDVHDRSRTAIVFSTVPLAEDFAPLVPGQLLVARRGAFVYDSEIELGRPGVPLTRIHHESEAPPPGPGPQTAQTGLQSAASPGQSAGPPAPSPTSQPDLSQPQTSGPAAQPEAPPLRAPPPRLATPIPASSPSNAPEGPRPWPTVPGAYPLHHHAEAWGPGRVMSVEHRTTYRYDKAVERSSHIFRLQPTHDRWQDLLHHDLFISVDGSSRSHEDVFGNHVVRLEIDQPFRELDVVARSVIRVRGEVPEDLRSPTRRFTIPLVWMPWQRQMMLPYLLPPELPETQLQELTEFAMSFVERQDYDLVQTLIDMNTTLFRDFTYLSGSTNLATTPFDVFTARKGVCQDFANLLICLARLLGVPARYRVGYIHTGADYENREQADASHAWAELYLPWTGWQGFDPTNGRLVGLDHIRVAAGRNYGDATPTSGTIYKGGGGMERLEVAVKATILEEAP